MFTDSTHQSLYAFDNGTTKTGGLRVDLTAGTIEVLPVSNLAAVNFTDPRDVTWNGAVVTFDNTKPIYDTADQKGLWLIVEYPPTVIVTTEN